MRVDTKHPNVYDLCVYITTTAVLSERIGCHCRAITPPVSRPEITVICSLIFFRLLFPSHSTKTWRRHEQSFCHRHYLSADGAGCDCHSEAPCGSEVYPQGSRKLLVMFSPGVFTPGVFLYGWSDSTAVSTRLACRTSTLPMSRTSHTFKLMVHRTTVSPK